MKRPNKFQGASRRPHASHKPTATSHRPQTARKDVLEERLRQSRIIIGQHALNEALAVRPKAFLEVWLRQNWRDSSELREWNDELKQKKISCIEKPKSALDRFGHHQGSVAFVNAAPECDWESLSNKTKSQVLLLDGIEDPHNLGAILRSSWLMGVDGVFLPADRSVKLSPAVHKVACGGVEHVPVTIGESFSVVTEQLKKRDYWVFGLSPKGEKSIYDLKMPDKVVWAIGSEDKGLRTTTERLCDELVSLPQVSAQASYNASVAAAIAMAEVQRVFRGPT